MEKNTEQIQSYSFTNEDINLITFALRRMNKLANFESLKNDAQNLLDHIERMKKEKQLS